MNDFLLFDPGDDPLDEIDLELLLGEPQDGPALHGGFEILLGVLGVADPSVVPAALPHEDPALNFDQGAGREVGEVGPPTAGRVEADFPLQGWASGDAPEKEKL